MTKQKIFLFMFVFSIMSAAVLGCLTGCFTTDTYHNEKHSDTIRKDIDAAHRDIDRVLGLDEPSPLVEEE
ncbi:MAG: hypothetical protein NG747_14350 [Candidatus Brocadia sp.]|nr:hypothetical protein [Candidatus Brocadia sp.]